MTSGFQLSILTPQMTLQLPNCFLVWGGTCFFINVLSGSAVLTGFLWNPQYCTLCCTVCRETLQPCRGLNWVVGRTTTESLIVAALFSQGSSLNFSCVSPIVFTLPQAFLSLQPNDFKVFFLELACLLKSCTTHTGCTSNAHSTISNPPTPGPTQF